jgi:DNA polymerase-1
MVQLPPVLERECPSTRMLLQVHDELLFEVPQADAPALADVATRIMEAAATLSVPLVVETGTGHSWAEAH